MESLIDEAKEIIEMSLNAQIEKEAYALKAKDWLNRVKTDQQTSEADHDHDVSCASCGNDMVCPSCGAG